MSRKYVPKVGDKVVIARGRCLHFGIVILLTEKSVVIDSNGLELLFKLKDCKITEQPTPEQPEQRKKERVVQSILDELNSGRLHKLHDRDIALNIYNKVIKNDN